MAEVKDFSAYAKKLNIGKGSDDTSDQEGSYSYQEKIRTHKLRVFFKTTILLVVAVLFVMVIYVSWRERE